MPRLVKATHPTGLQKRLIDEVASMMRANNKRLTHLAKETGIGKSYLSLLLHGHRQGTMATWDLLISTGKSWGNIIPQRLLVDGYDRPIEVDDVDDSDAPAPPHEGSVFDTSGPPPDWAIPGPVVQAEHEQTAGTAWPSAEVVGKPPKQNPFRPQGST